MTYELPLPVLVPRWYRFLYTVYSGNWTTDSTYGRVIQAYDVKDAIVQFEMYVQRYSIKNFQITEIEPFDMTTATKEMCWKDQNAYGGLFEALEKIERAKKLTSPG